MGFTIPGNRERLARRRRLIDTYRRLKRKEGEQFRQKITELREDTENGDQAAAWILKTLASANVIEG